MSENENKKNETILSEEAQGGTSRSIGEFSHGEESELGEELKHGEELGCGEGLTRGSELRRKGGNREYASDVFSMLMEDPEYALDVYNALNGSSYEDAGLVQTVRLESGISLSVRNDASFLIGGHASFYEHQSTYNPNMPLRNVIYFSDFLKIWIDRNEADLYGRKQIQIPTPHFVVFYNGAEERPDMEEMCLSASFTRAMEDGGKPDLEARCRVYNVNPGRNPELLGRSKVLAGYAQFVGLVRSYRRDGLELGEAVDRAMDDCVREDVLRKFFQERRSEVRKAMQLDFTWERREQLIRKEEYNDGKAEGRAEGRAEGISQTLVNNVNQAMKNFHLDLKKACEGLGSTVEEYDAARQELERIRS